MLTKHSGLVLCILSLFSTSVLAQTEAKLILKSFKTEQSQEKSGDELYISVTEYTKNHSPSYYQVPAFPAHWLSEHIGKVNNAIIWKKDITKCEDVDLMITLVEEDLLPWNVDDSLGSLKLKLTCQNDKLQGEWIIPNANAVSKSTEKNAFQFTGDSGRYDIQFNLENITTP